MTARTRLATGLLFLLSAAMLAVTSQEAFALRYGSEGNAPIDDPGWPKGAAAIFNTTSRIAYWTGTGPWHAECRGDAKALNAVLADFAKLEGKSKRIVVHDGVGKSEWLNISNEPAKRDAAKMDWSFMVWDKAGWEQMRRLPADINPTNGEDAANGPPSQIDIYTGGDIKWADVTVPKELKIEDMRLEAHGFKITDGVVLEGKVTDLVNKKPVTAMVRLQRVEPQKEGGYLYPKVAETATDADGHWVLKKTPDARFRVVVEAAGFVPRVVAGIWPGDRPEWHACDCGLALPATVAGRITDDAGKPLADVEVRIQNIMASPGVGYESPLDHTLKTDPDGRFRAHQIPVGKATIWIHKPGYSRPGLGLPITTPKDDIELKMVKSTRIVATVDFTGKVRPKDYIVSIEPEGGLVVGSWGGSGNINDKNQIVYDNVPPGKYILFGRPNPGSDNEQTDSVKVELKGGENLEVKLVAK